MLRREGEEGRRERDGMVVELKCVRGAVEGVRAEMREREDELLRTNGMLDEELREVQEVVGELKAKVCDSILQWRVLMVD